jgi:hypothetical protein
LDCEKYYILGDMRLCSDIRPPTAKPAQHIERPDRI